MKKYKSRFRESSQAYFLLVSSNLERNRRIVAIACKTESLGDKLEDYIDNVSDITIFNITPYGTTTREGIKNYIDSTPSKLIGIISFSGGNKDKIISQLLKIFN